MKYSGKIILAINLVLVIGISFPACFVIHLKGGQFEAFEGSSPYYFFYPVINLKFFFNTATEPFAKSYNKLLSFIFPIFIFLVITTKVTTKSFIILIGGT